MIYKTKKPIEAEGIVASFGMSSVSIYIPFLEMCKEIMWKDLKIDKVYKNKEDAAKLDVAVHSDRKSASKTSFGQLRYFIINVEIFKIPNQSLLLNFNPIKINFTV